jgi:hypothetical protein
MASAPAAPAPTSWLKKVGSFFSKVLHAVATEAAPVEKIAVPVATALLPMFAPEITAADGIFNSIVREAVAAETVTQAAGTTSGGGAQKLETVLTNIGPVLQNWISSNFPGAPAISKVAQSGLVNAVVAILNEVNPTLAPPAA